MAGGLAEDLEMRIPLDMVTLTFDQEDLTDHMCFGFFLMLVMSHHIADLIDDVSEGVYTGKVEMHCVVEKC